MSVIRKNDSAAKTISSIVNIPSETSKISSLCSQTYVASVENNGSTVKLISGSVYQISPNGVMRFSAARWSTSDPVTVCLFSQSSGTYASIENPTHYDKLQASLIASGAALTMSCVDTKIAKVGAGGSTVDTMDGYSYEVAHSGVMQFLVVRWSFGDPISVCRTRFSDKTVAASFANPSHYDKVQTTMTDKIAVVTINCKSLLVDSVGNGGSSITVSDGKSYLISTSGVMRFTVQRWSTGESVQVCESSLHDGEIAASIENPSHYDKVQAFRN